MKTGVTGVKTCAIVAKIDGTPGARAAGGIGSRIGVTGARTFAIGARIDAIAAKIGATGDASLSGSPFHVPCSGFVCVVQVRRSSGP